MQVKAHCIPSRNSTRPRSRAAPFHSDAQPMSHTEWHSDLLRVWSCRGLLLRRQRARSMQPGTLFQVRPCLFSANGCIHLWGSWDCKSSSPSSSSSSHCCSPSGVRCLSACSGTKSCIIIDTCRSEERPQLSRLLSRCCHMPNAGTISLHLVTAMSCHFRQNPNRTLQHFISGRMRAASPPQGQHLHPRVASADCM